MELLKYFANARHGAKNWIRQARSYVEEIDGLFYIL